MMGGWPKDTASTYNVIHVIQIHQRMYDPVFT